VSLTHDQRRALKAAVAAGRKGADTQRWFDSELAAKDEPWHGSIGGYTNHDCRCECCRTAWNDYRRKQEFKPRWRKCKCRKNYLEKTRRQKWCSTRCKQKHWKRAARA
jgi:hypothetical protein